MYSCCGHNLRARCSDQDHAALLNLKPLARQPHIYLYLQQNFGIKRNGEQTYEYGIWFPTFVLPPFYRYNLVLKNAKISQSAASTTRVKTSNVAPLQVFLRVKCDQVRSLHPAAPIQSGRAHKARVNSAVRTLGMRQVSLSEGGGEGGIRTSAL